MKPRNHRPATRRMGGEDTSRRLLRLVCGRAWPALFVLAGLFHAVSGPALADERRVALVIGNGAYRNTRALDNPGADAREIGGALERSGFAVTLRTDLDRAAMARTFRDFGDKADQAAIALVFYAGHGVQVSRGNSSENFLVPTDARLLDVRDVDDEAIGVGRVLAWIDGARSRVVILDACRDNPLAAQMHGTGGTRSVSRGLARVEASSRGTLLVFSTEPGALALDSGDAGHSPFARALLQHLTTPGLELRSMLTLVRADVFRATDGRQTPWSNDGLFENVMLVPGASPGTAPAAARPDVSALEEDAFASVGKSDDMRELAGFLQAFPNGRFAPLVRARLARLQAGSLGGAPDVPPRPAVADKPAVASLTPAAPAPVAVAPPVKPPVARPEASPRPVPAPPAVRPPVRQQAEAPQPQRAPVFVPAVPPGSVNCLLTSGAQSVMSRAACRAQLGVVMP